MGQIVAFALLTIGFAVFGGRLTNLVHDHGWHRSRDEHPGRFWSYIILTIICGLGIAWITTG